LPGQRTSPNGRQQQIGCRAASPVFSQEIDHLTASTSKQQRDSGQFTGIIGGGDHHRQMPPGFQLYGEVSNVLVDGADSNSGTIGLTYVNIISQKFSSKLILQSIDTAAFREGDFLGTWRREIGKSMLVDDAMRIWYNPELISKYFFVPGVICMILLIVTTNLTSLSLVKEKEIGTMEQLMVTPVKASEILLGKLIPFIIIGFLDIIFILLAALFIFDVHVKGSLVLLFLFSGFFLFSTLGLGIFISTVSRSQEQAMIIAFFFILNMNMLCGIIFPIENMPQVIQWFTYLLPLRYFAIIVRGLFLKGVGLDVLWDQGLYLLLCGIVIFALSLSRMKKKVS
jgi:ABC-2 type transport system permease protein